MAPTFGASFFHVSIVADALYVIRKGCDLRSLPQSPRRGSDYRQSVVAMPLDDPVHGDVELAPTSGKSSPKRRPGLAIDYHLGWEARISRCKRRSAPIWPLPFVRSPLEHTDVLHACLSGSAASSSSGAPRTLPTPMDLSQAPLSTGASLPLLTVTPPLESR